MRRTFLWYALLGIACLPTIVADTRADRRAPLEPEVVAVRSGGLVLHGLLWYPTNQGRVPGVLFNHGRGCTPQPDCDTRESRIRELGRLFSEHGYAFLALFRRGEGLSSNVGTAAGELRSRESRLHGAPAADALQVRLLETEQLQDSLAGLAFLRGLRRVDSGKLAVVGHSFGGSLSLLLAEHDPNLKAVVAFGAAAQSWDRSSALRSRLMLAAQRLQAPLLLLYAYNDYSIRPGRVLIAASKRDGEACRLVILPANGSGPEEGHDAVYSAVGTWAPTVFQFLDRFVARAGPPR
jgi:dienelactone hydrolase